VTPLLY